MAKSPANTTGTPALKHSHKGIIAIITVLVCLVLAFIIVYPVARDYYIALRTNERLSAELGAINARNEVISAQIDELKTQEGIEDRAREEFGWVHKGEKAVNITGLDTADSTTVMPMSIQAGSVDADVAWIHAVFDFIFDYDVNVDSIEEPTTDPMDIL